MEKRRMQWPSQRLAEWEQLRRQGQRHFIWAYGVLRWGGFMFCFSMAVFQYSHFGHVFSGEGQWLMRVALGLLTWVFVGFLYGRSQWRRNEQEYLQQRPGASNGNSRRF
jgi:hypothetical protein